MNNIAVIGMGTVGSNTAKLFGVKHTFDLQEEKTTATLEEISKDRIVFICLPSNVENEGNYQLNDIEQTIRQLEEYSGGSIYVIRSTVFPGYAMHLQNKLQINRIISNPEFLSEDTAEKDTKHPPFIVLGGLEGTYRNEVKAAYQSVIKSANVIETDNTSAEMAKLALNGFFATKVVYANIIFDYCQKTNANYQTVKQVLESHPFGYKNHAEIFHKNGRGAGGKCLRKDLYALNHYVQPGNDFIKEIKRENDYYLQESGKQ